MSAVAAILHSPEESLFSSFLKYAPVGLALCESSGKILSTNSTFEELLEFIPHRAPRALSELALVEGGGQVRALLAELFDGTRESFQVEGAASGRERKSLRWTVWAVHAERGKVESAVVMVEDLSDVAFSRQRLQQAERLETIGRLAGGVAHDFNNLLTGVLLYCDLLLSVLGPVDRARKYAEEIRTAGLQASGLVRQLLSVARSNKSLPQPVSLNEVADSMHNLLVRLIGDQIKLKVQLDPMLGLVRIDPVHAQQILLNLVLNARDALPTGGQISVETGNCKMQILPDGGGNRPENSCLPCALFAVEDNGLGMDEFVRAHLFEPFFTTKAGKGTGIGLATVHDIVSSNGGLIHVQSELGRGTRISILLPTVPESVPDSLADTNFYPTPNGKVPSYQSEGTTP
ncbi:MAG TPA: ATP-binding protein [Candidatus Binatia bacterium]|nr:ATP-binding protein [Candidatus Binatia bacterium]